ncbi:DinB family protein [Kutzneria sp. NPDC051319]|uniref:DinB family protein n=1 Tax=Kutzneria sp. NPDC051319 TaxID=3155047 RepID=UPI00342DC8F6
MTETTDLLAALAAARSALVRTADGLTDEQAAARPTVSSLCVGGVIKHVLATEEQWLRFTVEGASALPHELPNGVTWADIMAGAAQPPQWMIDHQNGFLMLPGETLADILTRYEKVAARTAEILATADLDTSHALPPAPWLEPGGSYSVRRVIMHVIAETAQHAGHADILRESLDGQKSG